MDACVQGSHVINQSVIYDLLPEARSRLTTVYITTMFAGGALGSFAGAQAYETLGLDRRDPDRRRVPRRRPALLGRHPPPRNRPACPQSGWRRVLSRQNSLSSGSASTCQDASAGWPMSISLAPAASSRSSSAA